MTMEITWLDFQLSTDNQNARHLASLFALFVLVCDWKRGYGGHLDFLI